MLFYSEATTRIYGQQVKCSWILPTYVNEVPYAWAKDINFSSAKKPKEKLDQKIEDLQQPQAPNHTAASSSGTTSTGALACERRRISGCHLSPPKTNVCELEPENDFRDVKILSQSQLGSQNPRTATRVACESIARSRGK